ncbi:MAG: alpha/beta hydrolase [Acidobacteria bacterium]|nr:MAG: alpha/beta hydrolase [Acidobacteriota bacterium]
MARRPLRTASLIALAAVIAALGTATHFYRTDLQQARDRVSGRSQIAQTACGPIEYAVAGSGPPVLVVHGAGGGFDQGLDFGAPLVEQGFRIIAVSRFGYLGTPMPEDASPTAQADAHACLLASLGIERVAVIGGSAGAPSSIQFALRHPNTVAALVLLVPAVYVPRPDNAPSVHTPPGMQLITNTALQSDFLFWIMNKVARGPLIRIMLATPPSVVINAPPDEQTRIRQVLDHVLPISARRDGLLNEANVIPSLPRYDLERVNVPTLALSCADDLFGTYDGARYTADHIPGARFVGYPSGGHLWVGHQQEVTREITQFLKRHLS